MRSGSPGCPRWLSAVLVAHTVARRVGVQKSRRVEPAMKKPLYTDMVRCANTTVVRGLRKSVRRKIRKGRYVYIF